MRIGIEAQRIFRKNKHGMDYVVLEEIKELQKSDTRNEYFVFVAPGEDRCLQDSKNVHIIQIGNNFYPLWEQFSLPRAVNQLNLDMLHCTSNTAPIHCKIPLILTLHDIIFLEPQDISKMSSYQKMGRYYRRLVVPIILNKCKRVITVSEFEKNNITSKIDISKEKITTIYNGFNEDYKPLMDPQCIYKKYIECPGYFFHFANTEPRKNTQGILIAYSKYLKQSKDKRKLLITGITKTKLQEFLNNNHIEDISDWIVLTDYIPSDDLPYIYNNAFALIFASFREGFGIPIIEAMACGIPVITSNVSSMPEVAGPDALLVSPENTDEIAKCMLHLENDELLYKKQKEIGIIRAQQFSWKYTAEQLLTVYEEVYRQRG